MLVIYVYARGGDAEAVRGFGQLGSAGHVGPALEPPSPPDARLGLQGVSHRPRCAWIVAQPPVLVIRATTLSPPSSNATRTSVRSVGATPSTGFFCMKSVSGRVLSRPPRRGGRPRGSHRRARASLAPLWRHVSPPGPAPRPRRGRPSRRSALRRSLHAFYLRPQAAGIIDAVDPGETDQVPSTWEPTGDSTSPSSARAATSPAGGSPTTRSRVRATDELIPFRPPEDGVPGSPRASPRLTRLISPRSRPYRILTYFTIRCGRGSPA